jgi:hypothetical protein
MADYYPLIARAVEGLSDRSPSMRQAVYERARTALMEQLRSLEPPLAEADIARERLSLDDAIDQVEATYDPEAHKRTVPATVGLPGAAPEPEPKPEPAPAPAAVVEAKPAKAEPAPAPAAERDWDAEPEPFPEPEWETEPERPEEPAFHAHLPRQPAEEPSYEDEIPAYASEAPSRPRIDSRSPSLRRSGQGRAIILAVVLALAIGAIAVAAWLLRDTPETLATQPQVAEAPVAPPPEPEAPNGKMDDRVGGGPPLPTSGQPGEGGRQEVAVAQRAIYYEEDTNNPQQPREFAGRAVWRLEGINAGQGAPLETAVRAVIEFPEVALTMNLLLRRNLDPTLPASHTIELTFTTPSGDPGRVVRDVGLLQFKNDVRARGTPVAGLPVPVRENLFLIGLSNLNTDVERNVELLLNRNWIDLPIRMVSGQRAIISFEKGVAGEQVMNDAFRQWQ